MEGGAPNAKLAAAPTAGGELVDSFRRSLDEDDVCMIADAAVTMEEDFLLDIISDLEPTASICCKNPKAERKSARQIAQRRRPADILEPTHAELSMMQRDVGACSSPGSSMSEASSRARLCQARAAGGRWCRW